MSTLADSLQPASKVNKLPVTLFTCLSTTVNATLAAFRYLIFHLVVIIFYIYHCGGKIQKKPSVLTEKQEQRSFHVHT